MNLSHSETLTILHGLRMVQERAGAPGNCAKNAGACFHFEENELPTIAEIDELCERINQEEQNSLEYRLAELLKFNFPWLGTDEPADDGADVISALSDLYEFARKGEQAPATVKPAAAPVKVWALATDGDDNGTEASIYTDEKQLYIDLSEKMGTEDEQTQAQAFADANDIEGLREFVSGIEAPFMFTYSIDEKEIGGAL